jgi:hypothetical protein
MCTIKERYKRRERALNMLKKKDFLNKNQKKEEEHPRSVIASLPLRY